MPHGFHIHFYFEDLSKPFQCKGGQNQDNTWLNTDEKSKNVTLKEINIGQGAYRRWFRGCSRRFSSSCHIVPRQKEQMPGQVIILTGWGRHSWYSIQAWASACYEPWKFFLHCKCKRWLTRPSFLHSDDGADLKVAPPHTGKLLGVDEHKETDKGKGDTRASVVAVNHHDMRLMIFARHQSDSYPVRKTAPAVLQATRPIPDWRPLGSVRGRQVGSFHNHRTHQESVHCYSCLQTRSRPGLD